MRDLTMLPDLELALIQTSLVWQDAAANRAQTVITDFEGAPATEEALYLMVESYDKLHMTELKNDAQRVYEQNFPNSEFRTKGLQADKSWWNPFN